jgi:asparagine synthase (glutamine-hydrolysing)
MCGIVGVIKFDGSQVPKSTIYNRLERIKHRGPDHSGVFVGEGFGYGHVRLSIIDLSDAGNQPIESDNGILIFNGEIYNYRELADQYLKQEKLHSSSDSEVLLRLLDIYGENKIGELQGMFGFSYFNKKNREHLIARDPFGIKPIYLFKSENELVFSSEIRGILGPDEKVNVCQEALNEHIYLGFSVGPKTIFKDIIRLDPGSYLKVSEFSEIQSIKFFDVEELINKEDDSSDPSEIEQVMKDSVQDHLVADVPISMMLSAGVDSNIILSMSRKGVKSQNHFITSAYTAGLFEDFSKKNDESEDLRREMSVAEKMANEYGIEFHKINAVSEDYQSIEEFVYSNEEPVANPSGLLINKICKDASERGQKILLTGHGGDEAFGGYRRYSAALLIEKYPRLLSILSFLAKPFYSTLSNDLYRLFRASSSKRNLSHISHLSLIGEQYVLEKNYLSKEYSSKTILREVKSQLNSQVKKNYSGVQQSMLLDLKGYLPSQNLINADKQSMNHSIEIRVPFIYKAVVKYGLNLRVSELLSIKRNKIALRNLGESIFPKWYSNSVKSGFGPSLFELVKKEEVKELLISERTKSRGIVNCNKMLENYSKEKLNSPDCMMMLNLAFIEQWFRIYID